MNYDTRLAKTAAAMAQDARSDGSRRPRQPLVTTVEVDMSYDRRTASPNAKARSLAVGVVRAAVGSLMKEQQFGVPKSKEIPAAALDKMIHKALTKDRAFMDALEMIARNYMR